MLTRTDTAVGGFLTPDLVRALEVAEGVSGEAPVPCVRRPGTTFVHRDGACRCFVGGPAPEFSLPAHVAQLAAC